MLESQERKMHLLNMKLKKMNLPTKEIPSEELISNEMERINVIKEARKSGIYYDLLEVRLHLFVKFT